MGFQAQQKHSVCIFYRPLQNGVRNSNYYKMRVQVPQLKPCSPKLGSHLTVLRSKPDQYTYHIFHILSVHLDVHVILQWLPLGTPLCKIWSGNLCVGFQVPKNIPFTLFQTTTKWRARSNYYKMRAQVPPVEALFPEVRKSLECFAL